MFWEPLPGVSRDRGQENSSLSHRVPILEVPHMGQGRCNSQVGPRCGLSNHALLINFCFIKYNYFSINLISLQKRNFHLL